MEPTPFKKACEIKVFEPNSLKIQMDQGFLDFDLL